MSFVSLHQREPGGEKIIEVEAFTLDASGCDSLRHPGQTPLLVNGAVVWAAEGKDPGQFSEPQKPVGFDPKTGAPIFDVTKLPPVGYDPHTGAPIYATAPAAA